MNQPKNATISRREFARRAALTSAVALVPASVLAVPSSPPPPPDLQPQDAGQPKLSTQSQAEVDARFQAILAQYGDRFSDAQKSELHRLCSTAQPGLDHLRAYPVANGDAPDLYLKPLVERDRKRR